MKNRTINGVECIEGETCFKIRGRWKSIDDPEIAFDYSKNTWEFKKFMTNGIVNEKMEKGWFTPTYRTIQLSSGEFVMDCRDCKGYFVPGKFELSPIYQKPAIIHPIKLAYSFCESEEFGYINKIVQEYGKSNTDISTPAKYLAQFLKGYSFGIEYETENGTIPTDLLPLLGLVPLKDGSLRKSNGAEPYEYATVPMSGAKGVQSIVDQCYFLNNCCTFDTDTSLHLHVGNLSTNRSFIVALYKLCVNLQAELFSLTPLYKIDPQYYLGPLLKNGDRRKNYARMLPMLNGNTAEVISNLFSIFSDGDELGKNLSSRGSKHRQDKKWNHNNRYFAINFEHLLLGKNPTVEFRLKDTSFNSSNVLSWLLICIAIVRYAENNMPKLLNDYRPSLLEVVDGLKNDFGTTSGTNYKASIVELLKKSIADAYKKRAYLIASSDSLICPFDATFLTIPSNFTTRLNSFDISKLSSSADFWDEMSIAHNKKPALPQDVFAAVNEAGNEMKIPDGVLAVNWFLDGGEKEEMAEIELEEEDEEAVIPPAPPLAWIEAAEKFIANKAVNFVDVHEILEKQDELKAKLLEEAEI